MLLWTGTRTRFYIQTAEEPKIQCQCQERTFIPDIKYLERGQVRHYPYVFLVGHKLYSGQARCQEQKHQLQQA